MCFSLAWLENLLIWIICIGAVIGILQLVVPWALSLVGVNLGPIPQIIRIVVGAIIAIAVIMFAFDMISCLLPRMHGL